MSNIQQILYGCRMVRTRIEGKCQISELLHVKLKDVDEVKEPLQKALEELEFKILFFKRKIEDLVRKLPGFDPSLHKSVDYISRSDLEDGFIDISLADSGKFYLNLTTGSIVNAEDVPDDIKDEPLGSC